MAYNKNYRPNDAPTFDVGKLQNRSTCSYYLSSTRSSSLARRPDREPNSISNSFGQHLYLSFIIGSHQCGCTAYYPRHMVKTAIISLYCFPSPSLSHAGNIDTARNGLPESRQVFLEHEQVPSAGAIKSNKICLKDRKNREWVWEEIGSPLAKETRKC